ncbi:hypothetical protein AUQ37_05400 [Candidatus Methanomethylophilus sp. 1R26]|nr:hypothetical protein AUQ37_05400 [Candidatus Methanomethylophilus sp. 1R26]
MPPGGRGREAFDGLVAVGLAALPGLVAPAQEQLSVRGPAERRPHEVIESEGVVPADRRPLMVEHRQHKHGLGVPQVRGLLVLRDGEIGLATSMNWSASFRLLFLLSSSAAEGVMERILLRSMKLSLWPPAMAALQRLRLT